MGGPIDPVQIPLLGVSVFAHAQGEGRMLPLNFNASMLWWYGTPALYKQVVLLGDVVLVGERDTRGYQTDVPASFAGDVLHPHGHRVKLKLTGEREWYLTETVANNYFDAIVLAFTMLERWPEAEDARVIPRPLHEE